MTTNLIEQARKALHLLQRYVSETPLGHQPHMITLEAHETCKQLAAALEQRAEVVGELPPLPDTPYQLYYEWPDDEDGYGGSEVVDGDAYSADQMRDYARAALAQQARPQWRTIDSAPKDGTHILLCNKAGASEGGWLSDIDHGADWEGQIGMAGWWRTDGTDWPNTHWMPLPEAPQ